MIRKNIFDFHNPFALKCLYTPLVHSLLEYAAFIWDQNNIGHNNQPETTQNKVFRFIFHNCNIQKTPHNSNKSSLKTLNLKALKYVDIIQHRSL